MKTFKKNLIYINDINMENKGLKVKNSSNILLLNVAERHLNIRTFEFNSLKIKKQTS